MRKKIHLWIDSVEADINDESLVLFNYTQDDTTNPTTINNSYSIGVKLPGTPTNEAIFAKFVRNDSVGFNALRKVPFVILDDTNSKLEEGYLKLDHVERSEGTATYHVSLYGGLGAFLHSLSYLSNGNKMTLADVSTWYVGNNSITFPTFIMDRTVIDKAWGWLNDGSSPGTSFDWVKVFNFAPCYNGIPDTDFFDADKVLVDLNTVDYLGIPTSASDGGTTYNANNGFLLAQLDQEYTEQEIRDCRSYLQRPCMKLEHFFDTLKHMTSYDVVLDSAFFNDNNPYYKRAWITIPTLQDNLDGSASGTRYQYTVNAVADGASPWGWVTPSTGVYIPSIMDVWTLQPLEIWPKINSNSYGASIDDGYFCLLFMNYLNSTQNPIGHGRLYILYSVNMPSNTDVDNALRLRGLRLNDFEVIYSKGSFNTNGDWHGTNTGNINTRFNASVEHTIGIQYITVEGYMTDNLVNAGNVVPLTDFSAKLAGNVIGDPLSGRTGAQISKARLLEGTLSPAEYLISYCKMFNLHITCKDSTITIQPNSTYYNGNVIDISDRVETKYKTEPMYANARWFTMTPSVDCGNGDIYEKTYGNTYGRLRIDTNYPFNADEKELLDIPFIGTVQTQAKSRRMAFPMDKSTKKMSWQEYEHTFTYGVPGNSLEVKNEGFSPTAYQSYNTSNAQFYDRTDRPQFCDEENSSVDGANCLLFLTDDKENVWVTDDCNEMILQNKANACWLITEDTTLAKNIDAPHFSRFLLDGSGNVTASMEYSTPKELYTLLPQSISDASNVYTQFWGDYISDRYDRDSRICTRKVNWRGIKVDADLLRNFYYFDNCVWALNKIKNYSLTTEGNTECEFIKIKDTDNYGN